jgi:hypothetical protein
MNYTSELDGLIDDQHAYTTARQKAARRRQTRAAKTVCGSVGYRSMKIPHNSHASAAIRIQKLRTDVGIPGVMGEASARPPEPQTQTRRL